MAWPGSDEPAHSWGIQTTGVCPTVPTMEGQMGAGPNPAVSRWSLSITLEDVLVRSTMTSSRVAAETSLSVCGRFPAR
nr:hypothetical protein GCM10010200_033050 [Actinomadura rugatobispora]